MTDLPPDIAALVGQETKWSPWGADPVSLAMIRQWCEAIEDGNPACTDEGFVRNTDLGGVIAPPTMGQAFARPAIWPPPKAEAAPNLPFEGCESLVVRNNLEFMAPLFIGDRIRGMSRLVEISPQRTTRVGTGHFVTNMRILANQRGQTVSTWSLTTLRYPRGSQAKEGGDGAASDAKPAPAGQPAKPRKHQETRRWDDVREGDTLAPVALPITVTRLVMLANATRDFYEVHHDRECALANGARDIFVNNTAYAGFFNRAVNDWGGPLAKLRKLDFQMREMNCPKNIMTGTGRVAKKYASDIGERLVDLSLVISNQGGPTTFATATIELP